VREHLLEHLQHFFRLPGFVASVARPENIAACRLNGNQFDGGGTYIDTKSEVLVIHDFYRIAIAAGKSAPSPEHLGFFYKCSGKHYNFAPKELNPNAKLFKNQASDPGISHQ